MPSVVAYHRPQSLDDAVALLTGPNRRAIGGGTVAVPQSRVERDVGVEVVDLQDLGLDRIDVEPEPGGGRLRLGAMVRVGDLVANPAVPPLIADLARRELPSTVRNQATVGGTVALADPQSVLTAGLLAHDGVVELHDSDPLPLARCLVEGLGGRIITAVTIDPGGRGTISATGRTPADEPIVAAVARAAGNGPRVVLTGVGRAPIEVDPTRPAAGLDPPDDFRGSADYRRHLATVLAARAVAELEAGAR